MSSAEASVTTTTGAGLKRGLFSDNFISWAMTIGITALILIFLVMPLWAILVLGFSTPEGFGFGNFTRTFTTARFWTLVLNSLGMALTCTIIVTGMAYAYAYTLQRAHVPFKSLLRMAALIPLFAPSLVQAQGLVLLLGRNGILNRWMGMDIDIYGFWGVVIANALYAFPYAFLILSAALAVSDARLHESAEVLGAGPWRIFRTQTLPATRYGLAAACFVVFNLVMTDFGNPMVIGGDFNVLATEVYNQVIGQAQFGLGAVIGIVLLMPAIAAKIVEKRLTKQQQALLTSQARPMVVRPSGKRDLLLGLYAYFTMALILSVILIVVLASFVKLWPYNMSFTLQHYQFDVQNGTAPLWNSVKISLATAVLGVAIAGMTAIAVQKFKNPLTGPLAFLAILPSAVPGMVLGLGYVLAFNNPSNPLHFLYGSFALIIILSVYYNHAHAFLISSTSLKQISGSFDEASTMLGGSVLTTLRKVTLPLLWPTLLGVGVLFFMRTMVSLSAVIFLTTPATQVASISVLQLSDRGAVNQAAAFSVCIMLIVIAALLIVRGILWAFGAKHVTLIR
ncbi:ABC transporter permease subunit [Pseudochrobactrum algeriensis]|uniref:ABC transporter permease subunit n=1 Tax=Pseudochrobactrum algeriensis TaxID=2834768 RepID=UPI001BCFECBC|nr:ABC transporter permease subunit [Pseudochrobactrum algeriensis]MBX8813607.1 ABC transporter permease subunit [Ochrobactrum sp. MR34]QVQ37561.1 ABC transporter permease subunit [Pseudochrobactrum algeriensis]QVQ40782.1 ABC transporter permease subunit [Pseudochrobactrum algeriensis]QVQ44704.1 ABC transporter permease subunit [Pseudochrobactrum algeriensis]